MIVVTVQRKRERLAPEARRAQLIGLGVEMLSTKTLEQLSVEALAAEAGISRGLLFHYFSSKQDFYVAVVREVCNEMLRRTTPAQSPEDPLGELRRSLAAYVDYVLENPDGYLVLVRGAGTSDPAIRAVIDDTRAAMAARLAEHASELGMAEGTERELQAKTRPRRPSSAPGQRKVPRAPHGLSPVTSQRKSLSSHAD